MMILRSWREQKILLKRKYPFLLDEDFLYEEGEKETMLEKLRKKLKMTKEQLDLVFAEIQKS